jgi:hypothetical protein
MAITFTSSAITVVDGEYTFEDIYQASNSAGNSYCRKLGTSYLISIDLLVGDESTYTLLEGQNISVVIEGDLFQIKKGSELRLGTIDENTGATANGVFISCPNIANGYGFGSNHKVDGSTQSGNIFLYNSFIDIYGFWGFFGGAEQHCEVIDCLVNGYGRIEGANSIIRNVTAQKSNGRYGTLATKGTIKEYENLTSKNSLEYSGHSCSMYFNPAYAPNMRVTGGIYDGYSEGLVYCEKNKTGVEEAGIITFVDSDIRNGYGAYYSDSNTQVKIVYTFEPTFKDENNNVLSYVDVVITNNQGEEVYNGISDSLGNISVELLKHREDKNTSEDYVYYDVTATKDDISITRRYDAGVTYKNFPFFVSQGSSSSGSGDCCLEDIQAKLDSLQNTLLNQMNTDKEEVIAEINENEAKIDSMAENNNQLLITLGEEIDENQTIIESKTGNTKMFL